MLCLLVASDTAFAFPQTCRWTGLGDDDNWSTPLNWAECGGGTPQNGDVLHFLDGAARPANVDNLPDLIVNTVRIEGRGAVPARAPWNITGATGVRLILDAQVIVVPSADDGTGPSLLVPIKLGTTAGVLTAAGATAPFHLGDVDLNGRPLQFDLGSPVTVTGTISGTGGALALSKSGPSVLTLNDNSFTGQFQITAGTAVANTARALGAGNVTFAFNGGILTLADGVVIDQAIRLQNGTIKVEAGTSATLAGRIDVPFGFGQFSTQGTLSVTGLITVGVGLSLSQFGAGTLTLSNPANAFDSFAVTSGTLRLGAQGAIPSGTDLALALQSDDPATLDLNNFDLTLAALSGTERGRVLLGSGTLTINPAMDIATIYNGTIAGTGNFVKSGDGQFQLGGSAANTYTGTTTVQAGRLELSKTAINGTIIGPLIVNGGGVAWGADEQVADRAAVTVNAPGVLFFEPTTIKETIGSLAGNGQIGVQRGTLTVGANNASTTFAGTLFGDPAQGGLPAEAYFRVIKVGTGTLTLTGDSTLSDQAVVDAGTLVLDGKLKGRGVLARGGVFGGTGTLFDTNGVVTFVSMLLGRGGVISPGHSPGILHGDRADLDLGSTFVVQINGAAPGTGYDQLDLLNGLTLGADARLTVTRTFAAPKGSQFTIVHVAPGQSADGTFAGLPEGATVTADGQHFSITYHGGPAQNSIVLTALVDAPLPTYFLSEGATGGFFDEDVLIANPNDAAAPVTLTFSKESGEQVVATRTVPAQSHLTVHVDQIPALEETAASAQVTSDARLPLVVERSMFWDATYYAGHTGSAVDQPAADWFFAEGSQGFFNTFVLVINPNATPSDVTFTFFRKNEPAVVKTLTVGATTRLTLPAGDVPELVNRSFGIAVHATQPIMAERSMYFGTTPTRLWSGGTESAGVTAASTHWFLAEGATGGFFDTFVLLSNPQSTPAHVQLQYLLDTGETITVPKTIAANARLTTNIEAEDDVRLHNAAVSTVVTADVPIIAERSMYWPGAAVPWGEGHNSFGVVDAGTKWGLSEGRIGGPLNFHTYILLANPQTTAAEVTVNYLRENGTPITKTYTVAPTSRFNIDTSAVTELHDESFGAVITVTNNVNIIVERSMYWDSNGFSFSGGTNATGIRLP